MIHDTLISNIRTMVRRFERHVEGGDHILRPGSQQEIAHGVVAHFREIDPETNAVNTDGHIVAPGGMGKTISGGDFIIGINTMLNGRYVLGDPTLGKRVLITASSNQLVSQWGDRLLGERDPETGIRAPSVFGDRFTEAHVGIYHAGLSIAEKAAVLEKPVVIITHDSLRALYTHADPKTSKPSPLIRPELFDVNLIDEEDDKPRGDVTGAFYREVIFPECMVIGLTATPLFRSGKTIGDYLHGGKKPIVEITHQEGVARKEIAGHVNIIVKPEIDPSSIIKPKTNRWDDYSEAEQLSFIKQTGTDEALLQVIKLGTHPKTGKPLRDMMQLHQAVNVEHAIHIAEQLNKVFGDDYAGVVWGGMDDDAHDAVKWAFTSGKLKAVVQCKLWGRGTDFPPLELTVQHAPTLSPNKLVQFFTRASRKDDGKKIAIYLSPFIEGIDQLVIGEVLGGMYMIPGGYEFPPTAGKGNKPSEPEPWPHIDGVKVFATERQLGMFAEERQRQRYVNGLQTKPATVMNLNEMAVALGIQETILHDRVFGPLQEAYEKREAREKFVDIPAGRRDDVLHVRGRMFPVWRMGHFRERNKEIFGVDRGLLPLCEHTLYGRLDKVPPEMLDKGNVKRLTAGRDMDVQALWQDAQDAFFHRKPYERTAEIRGVTLNYDSFGFYRNRDGASEFVLAPDALIPAYQIVHQTDEKAARKWAEQPAVRQCKPSDWFTVKNALDALEINPLSRSHDAQFVTSIFDEAATQSRGMRIGYAKVLTVGKGRTKHEVTASRRWLPSADLNDQIALTLDKSSFEWIKKKLDGSLKAANRPGRTGSKAAGVQP